MRDFIIAEWVLKKKSSAKIMATSGVPGIAALTL